MIDMLAKRGPRADTLRAALDQGFSHRRGRIFDPVGFKTEAEREAELPDWLRSYLGPLKETGLSLANGFGNTLSAYGNGPLAGA